jgi:hypothetical protein
LFAQILVDEVQSASDLRRKFHAGIALGVGERITRENFASWTLTRLSELIRVAHAIDVLVNQTAKTGFGPPGQPGDPELIAFAAQQVGACYREAIEWATRVRCASAEDEMYPALEALAGFSGDIIQKVEEFGPHVLSSIDSALAEEKGGKRIVEFSLVIEVTGGDEFRNRVQALSKSWQ